jgi:hypothetical protein
MKKNIFAITTLVTLFSSSALASKFCDGYEHGYPIGYKQAYGSNPSSIPYCPSNKRKDNYDSEASEYEHGIDWGLGWGKSVGKGKRASKDSYPF